MRGQIVLLGLAENAILHVISPAGDVQRRLGTPLPVPPGVPERWTRNYAGNSASGRVLCIEDWELLEGC
jgi:hypothetical protein